MKEMRVVDIEQRDAERAFEARFGADREPELVVAAQVERGCRALEVHAERAAPLREIQAAGSHRVGSRGTIIRCLQGEALGSRAVVAHVPVSVAAKSLGVSVL